MKRVASRSFPGTGFLFFCQWFFITRRILKVKRAGECRLDDLPDPGFPGPIKYIDNDQ